MELNYPIAGLESVQGRRISMEDTHCNYDDVAAEFPDLSGAVSQKISFYGVYDGHGGKEAALLCQQYLHENIMRDSCFEEGDFGTALRNGFYKTDKDVLETSYRENWNSGTTAVVSVLTRHHIYIANTGDSEAVLGRRTDKGYEAILLSTKHKPSDVTEKERIRKAGGHVVFGRVMGSLAVARSIGDRNFKYPYNKAEADFVSADPFVNKIDLVSDYEFLIIACDGLWDKFSYEEAVQFTAAAKCEGKSPTEAAQTIVKEALDKGTLDNVTVIIVYLSKTPPKKDIKSSDEDDEESDMDVWQFLKDESARRQRQKEAEQLKGFSLPPEETVIAEFKTYLEKKLLHKGTMLITQNYICFFAAKTRFGKHVTEHIAINDIENIQKKKAVLVFSNSIQITMKDGKKITFSWKNNAEARDNVFSKLFEIVLKIGENDKPKIEQKQLTPVASSNLTALTTSGSQSAYPKVEKVDSGTGKEPNGKDKADGKGNGGEAEKAPAQDKQELSLEDKKFQNWSRFND